MNEGSGATAAPRAVVKSADRALDVIEYVTGADTPPTFTQIARGLQLPKSSLSQLLGNLVARRYLDLDAATATYRPGEGLLSLVRRAATAIPVRALVMPVLEKLRDELNETASFSVRHGDELELLASAPSRHSLVYIMNVGECAPLYALSAGKVVLAYTPSEEFEAWIERVSLKRFTPNTLTNPADLRQELVRVRREGFGYSKGEYSPGIHGVATAVTVGERVVGAINFSIPMARFDEKLHAAAKRALSVAANQLSRVLTAREVSAQKDHNK